MVGLYETYDAQAIAILDVRGKGCLNSRHRPNTEMDLRESANHSRVRQEASATTATITCPHCGHQAAEPIPVDACLYFYVCTGCERLLRPKRGDCCVFCSYADRSCPYC